MSRKASSAEKYSVFIHTPGEGSDMEIDDLKSKSRRIRSDFPHKSTMESLSRSEQVRGRLPDAFFRLDENLHFSTNNSQKSLADKSGTSSEEHQRDLGPLRRNFEGECDILFGGDFFPAFAE